MIDDDGIFDAFIDPTPEDHKLCRKCQVVKPLTEFNKNSNVGGYRSDCKECSKAHRKQYYADNSDHIKEKNRRYWNKHIEKRKASYREKFPQIQAQRKEYRAKNKDKSKTYNKEWYDKNLKHDKKKQKEKNLKHYFNLTLDQFNDMVKTQDNKCKICTKELDMAKGTHVDHDHNTGKVRGVLCHPCNTKLGWYEKNSTGVENYLSTSTEVDVKDLIPSHAFLH